MKDQSLHTYICPSGQVIALLQADLTRQQVDAIVNAANAHLMHGGGIAALISQRGGPTVDRESAEWVQKHGPVSHADPAYTSGGDLPARYIIHAVGPVWGSGDEDARLEAAIAGSLRLAGSLDLASIAFPAISTGIFGFPKPRAARVIYRAFLAYFEAHPDSRLADVRMVVYDQPTVQAFEQVWLEVFTS